MPDHTVKRIDEMEAIYAGHFKRARAELGVSSFGLAVIDFPPNVERYPEHDHTHDGQEEVFVTLSGRGEISLDGERVPLDPDTIVRAGPEVKRRIFTGKEPLRLLIIGGVPGGVYEPPDLSKLGEPDPLTAARGAA